MLLALLAAARADVPDRGISWCRLNLWGARWICGIRHRVIGLENIPAAGLAAHRDVEAQLDLGDAGAHAVLSAARLRRQEGAAVDPVLRLGIRARVADHHRPQGRHGRDAADRDAGPRALRAGLLDRRLSRRHADSRRHARQYKTGGARLAIATRRARSCRSRTMPAICGRRAFSASGRGRSRLSIGKPIAPDGKDAQQLTAEVETWIEDEVARLGMPA